METVPKAFQMIILALLVVAMPSATARVTINMTAAAETLEASKAVPAAGTSATATTTAGPTAAAVHQAATTTNNKLQEALAQLLSPNGTRKVNITMPKLPPILQPRNITVPQFLQNASKLSFNITLPKLELPFKDASSSNSSATKAATLKMATDVLQQLTQLQPSLAKLDALFKNLNTNAGTSATARGLLEDVGAATDEATFDPAASARSLLADDSTTAKNASEVLNSRKLAQKINIAMSDSWLVLYSGFKVAQVSVQLLAALLRAGSTGVVTVDPALLLSFADLGANFSSAVSYLLYSGNKAVADLVTPFGIHKPAKN